MRQTWLALSLEKLLRETHVNKPPNRALLLRRWRKAQKLQSPDETLEESLASLRSWLPNLMVAPITAKICRVGSSESAPTTMKLGRPL